MFEGLSTNYVNCGKYYFDAEQGMNVEILSPKISTHRANVICYYYMEGKKKVQVTYYEDGERFGSEVYFYDSKESNQHYYSKHYAMCEDMPAKYSLFVNGLKDIHKRVFGERPFYTNDVVIENSSDNDWENKILVMRPSTLKPQYRTKDNQLWLATGGFGCSATAIGTTVYAICLSDGESSSWRRGNFMGEFNGKLTDEQYAKLETILQPMIERLEKRLSAGQETGVGDWKYELQGDARKAVEAELSQLQSLL